MQLRGNSRTILSGPVIASLVLAGISVLLMQTVPAAAKHKAAQEPSQKEPHFAFWYEDWKPDTWEKLQPANVLIGVPENAVADIHGKGGRALNYVTFYQAKFGTAFLKNQDDLAAVGFHTPRGYLPSAFGGENNYVLCSNSQELRNRALAYVDRIVRTSKFDGLFVDNSYLPPASTEVCDAKHTHVTPGESGGSAYVDLLGAIEAAVKKTNPSALIILNAGNPTKFNLLSHGHTTWDFSDYVLWESYGYASVVGAGHDRWKQTIDASFDLAKSPNSQKVLALSYPKTDVEALYSYAVASVFGFKYSANLGVSEQGKEGSGGHYGIFEPKLPHLIGSPTNAPPAPGSTVLRRDYKNGSCFVNLGQSDYVVVADRNSTVYAESGSSKLQKGKRYTLPPSKGLILIY